jgi:exosortase/archaeosortase family protein
MSERGERTGRGRADRALIGLALRFLAYAAVLLSALVWLDGRTGIVTRLAGVTATIAAALMNGTGVAASSAGATITLAGRELLISPECTGIAIAAVLSSLVLAYPVRASSRVIGVLLAVAAVLVANLVRLVAIAHFSGAPDMVFIVAHDFLFQVGMVAAAIGVWSGWLSFARARER